MSELQTSLGISRQQDTLLQRAELCIDLGKWQEALTLLSPLLADGSDPAAFRLASIAHANLGNTAVARRVVEQGLSRWPEEASLHATLALVLHALSLPYAGLRAIRQAVGLDPEWYAHHYVETNILNHLGQFDAAEAAIHRALRLKPDDADCLWMLAAVLRNQGKYDEARNIVRRGLAISPNDADLLMLNGNLEMERTKRIRHFRASLRANPLNIGTQKMLHRSDRGWRRNLTLTVAVCLSQGLLHVLSGPQWTSTLLLVMPGLWLAKGGDLAMLWAVSSSYCFFDNAHYASNNLASFLIESLGDLIGSAILGGVWALSIAFAWLIFFRQPTAFLTDLWRVWNQGMLAEKLRDLASSNSTFFNLAVCAVPTFWPLAMHFSEYPDLMFLWMVLPELAILWLARMLFLPRNRRYVMMLLLLCVILVLPVLWVSKNIHLMEWDLGNQLSATLLSGVYSLLVVNFFQEHFGTDDRTGST